MVGSAVSAFHIVCSLLMSKNSKSFASLRACSFAARNGLELFWAWNYSINCIGLELFRAVPGRERLTERALSDVEHILSH
jgi:hypothetical protein